MVWERGTRLPASQETSRDGIASSRPLPTPIWGSGDGQGGAAPPALPLQPSPGPAKGGKSRAPTLLWGEGMNLLPSWGTLLSGEPWSPLSATPLPTDTSQDTPAQGKPTGRCGEHSWKRQWDSPHHHSRSQGTLLWLPPPPRLNQRLLSRLSETLSPNKRHICLQNGSGPKMPPSPRLHPHPKGQVLPVAEGWPGSIAAQRSFGGISKAFLTSPSNPKYYIIAFSWGFPPSCFILVLVLFFFTPGENKCK